MRLAPLSLIAVALILGCLQSQQKETTTLFITTTTTQSTTTTIEVKTTILSTSTIRIMPKTTTTSTTTSIPSECSIVCTRAGYKDGVCRINGMECRRRNEIYYPPGATACAKNKDGDSCCCQPRTSKNL